MIADESSAAWDFHNKHKDSVKWDLSVINPSYVCDTLTLDCIYTLIQFTGLWRRFTLDSFMFSKFWLTRWSSQPILHEVAAIESLNTSALDWANVVLLPDAGGRSHEDLAKKCLCWVDVRDLGEAHVRALEKEEASGERIIISSGMEHLSQLTPLYSVIFTLLGSYAWQDWSTSLPFDFGSDPPDLVSCSWYGKLVEPFSHSIACSPEG